MATTNRRRASRRTVRWVVRLVAVVLVAVTAVVSIHLTRHGEESVTETAPAFKTVAVQAGSLGINEKISGSLELSDVTSVVHRIEGQLGTTSGGSGSAPSSGLSSSLASSLTSALDGVDAVTADDCDTSSTLPPDTTSTTTGPDDTSGSSTSSTSTTSTSTTSTSTTPTSTTPTTVDGYPADSSTTTTDPCTTTTSITTAGGQGGGGFPTGSSGGTGTSGGTGAPGSTGQGSTARLTEVVTSVIDTGSAVSLGTVLYTVESRPVVALAGSVPAWRTITEGDTGQDVRQLELSLVALGYAPEGMTVDDEFDADTTTAVEAWQAGYGLEITGDVTIGSVVFVATSATVRSVNASVGDTIGDGDVVLSLAAASQRVVIDVPSGDEAVITPGLEVVLGSGTGTVSLLRSVERSGSVVVQAVIVPTAPLDQADGAVVSVTVSVDELDGVLTVPSEALVSRLDGNYALQVVLDGGFSEFRTVEVLGISGSTAAIRGDGIAEGTEVLQPA